MGKYILVSLDEKKSKEFGHVISNLTARKILDYLGEHEKATPVQLSKKLNIPLSTVTYSIKNLIKEGLIEKKDFAWSDKGKKVWFYAVAQKMVIIVPKGFDWKSTLGKILPVALVGFVTSTILGLTRRVPTISRGADVAMLEAEPVMAELAMDTTTKVSTQPDLIWLWVLIGTIFVILLILVIDYWRTRK